MQKTNWEPIKTEYVTTRTTYKELAVKHNVPFNTVKQLGRKYKWGVARKEYSENVAKKILQKTSENEAIHIANQIKNLQATADNLSAMLALACQDTGMYKRHLVRVAESQNYEGDPESKVSYVLKEFDIANTKLLKDLSVVLLNITAAVRNLYGIPTKKEQMEMDLAAQRLEMDKRKLDYDEGASEIVVKFEDGIAELAE